MQITHDNFHSFAGIHAEEDTVKVSLSATSVIFASVTVFFDAGYAGEHIMGHRLDVRDRPVNTPVISRGRQAYVSRSP